MTESMRELRISPAAISANVEKLIADAKTPDAMVVVKADGYGHGAIVSARAALEGGATWLGTADITEALELRESGISAPTLAWLIGPGSDLVSAISADIDLGISSLGQLEAVAKAAAGIRRASVHLKIDSGMGRGGATERDWAELFGRARALQDSGAVSVRGVFTHMSLKSESSDAEQAEVFRRAVGLLREAGIDPELTHAASSTVAARSSDLRFDMVRLGVASYGVPVTAAHEEMGLTPAMRFRGQVIVVKRLPAGHGVGYDMTYTTERETTMALVPLGYADGVPRHGSSIGPVSIGDKRFRIAGRVSMDQVTIDVGDTPVSVGEWATLWGDPARGEPHVSQWADAIGTNSYELITRVGHRVRRVIE